jgi:hypothetical protein
MERAPSGTLLRTRACPIKSSAVFRVEVKQLAAEPHAKILRSTNFQNGGIQKEPSG